MEATHINTQENTISGIITIPAPFDFTQSVAFLDESGAKDRLDVIDKKDGILQRAMLLNDHPYLVTLTAQEGTDLEIIVQSPDGEPAPHQNILQLAIDWATRRFWLDIDMDAVKEAISGDEFGDMLIDTQFPMRPANYPSAWEALLISINHAQVYSGLAQQLDDNIAEVYGMRGIFDEQTYYLTPRPFDLLRANPDELRGMRFSRQKADYLTTIPKTLMEEMTLYDFDDMRSRDGQEIIKQLKELYGVGPWTAQNVAMRGLPHTDVFIDEKSTRKAIAPFYFRNVDDITKKTFQETVARFAPYRSFACYYTYMHYFRTQRAEENQAN